MSVRVAHNVRLRRNFGKIRKIVDIPNLIEIQRRSYEEFLQLNLAPGERRDTGRARNRVGLDGTRSVQQGDAAAAVGQQRVLVSVVVARELHDAGATGGAARQPDGRHRRLGPARDHADLLA